MTPILSHPLRLADLPQRKPTRVTLGADDGQLTALAARLGVDSLRKLRFEAVLTPGPGADWTLTGQLGATVVQPCRVTTDPVTTRIDEAVSRRYLADLAPPEAEDTEMPEDDGIDALPDTLDLGEVLEEALALAIPAFPRAEGAEEINLSAAPPGAEPLSDEATKPFAALAAFKAKLEDDS